MRQPSLDAYNGDELRARTDAGRRPIQTHIYGTAAGLPVLLDGGNRRYVSGAGGLAYVASSLGTVDVVHADGLGSVRALTDAGAQVVQTYAADEYGLPTESQGSRRQPVQWAGEERDEQGLVFLRARSYEPATGRFLQADPLRQSAPGITGWNRYAYATNNPVRFTDPSGLYEYTYEWYIGQASVMPRPESIMGYFQQHPREIFPFELGQCDTIELGARCDLVAGPAFASYAPVEVSDLSSTSFTFTALPGHFDYNPSAPRGSWVRFTIFERDRRIYLQQKARALVEDPFKDFVAPKAALFIWQQQAMKLRRIFNLSYPAEPFPQLGG